MKYFVKFVVIILKHARLILVSEPRKFMRNENGQGARLYLLSDMAWAVAYSIPRLPRAY